MFCLFKFIFVIIINWNKINALYNNLIDYVILISSTLLIQKIYFQFKLKIKKKENNY